MRDDVIAQDSRLDDTFILAHFAKTASLPLDASERACAIALCRTNGWHLELSIPSSLFVRSGRHQASFASCPMPTARHATGHGLHKTSGASSN